MIYGLGKHNLPFWILIYIIHPSNKQQENIDLWIIVFCFVFEMYFKLSILYLEKKEEIWLRPMAEAPTPAEMSKGQSDNTNNTTNSSITERLLYLV